MSPDLIKRAAEKLVREREMSLVERAAQKLGQTQAPAQAPSAASASDSASALAPEPAGAGASAPLPRSPATDPGRAGRAGPALKQHTVAIDVADLRQRGFVTPDSEATRVAEEFRIIKRPLLTAAFAEGEQRIKNGHLIMVTSARPNEGKTFVALNLAMSLVTERNLNVLLVDADFKNPSLPRQLGFKAEKGLIDVLAEHHLDLGEVMLRTSIKNLTLLPAGFEQANATELLASQQMADLVQEIAERYHDRVIIFDSPPVLASSEPSVLAMHVGQIVFVVEAATTNRRAVSEALSLIGSCPNISLVLNRRLPWLSGDQFGTYYGYGSGKGTA